MKGCQRITNRGLSSIHRSRPRELKRLSKPRAPSELKATASSSCSRVGGALFVLSLGKVKSTKHQPVYRRWKKCQEKANNLLESATIPTTSPACSTTLRREGHSMLNT